MATTVCFLQSVISAILFDDLMPMLCKSNLVVPLYRSDIKKPVDLTLGWKGLTSLKKRLSINKVKYILLYNNLLSCKLKHVDISC